MLIVLEGPDGGGKTTLAEKLRSTIQSHALFIRSNSRASTPGEIIEYSSFLQKLSRLNTPVIADRHPWISEKIYGPILRGGCLVEEGYDFPSHDQILVVYCNPPLTQLVKNLQVEPQRDGVMDRIFSILAAYETLMGYLENIGLTVFRHDHLLPEEEQFNSEQLKSYQEILTFQNTMEKIK